jgi:hypothetical protein
MGFIRAVEELSAMTEAQRTEFLGQSDELNTAYEIIRQELPKIKAQAMQLADERKARAAGGGALREKVAIAEADPFKRALKEEAIAQVRLEVMQALKKGEEGAIASGAAASAEETLLRTESLPTRVVGATTNTFVPQAAAALGADKQGAATAAASFARAATNALFGIPNFAATTDALKKAADDMKEAAKEMQAAAGKMNTPASNTKASRAQAAGAN